MKIIKKIRIRSFRSIMDTTRGNKTTIDCNDLNIIVGNNDAGKSNYLRALNLFFNNETDINTPLEFWKDYSYQRHGKRKEKNRIEIELVISPPNKQAFTHAEDIKWKKIWKEGSILPIEEFSYIDSDKEFILTARSSFYKWLKKIKFKYVPAIKSKEYFDNLLFNLYDVLQKDTTTIEKEFNKQVSMKTKQISDELQKRLGMDSTLQFKGDSFKSLFSHMEFGSTDGRYMLAQRGDGIKVRHIPIILQNIAEAELREQRLREPIANTIWGFEEPENNLEFTSAYNLAENFLNYLTQIHFQDEECSKYDEGIQIFITTHSPIFYTLGKKDSEKIQSFFVSKGEKEQSMIKPIDKLKEIENDMRLLPLFEMSESWEEIISHKDKAKQLQLDLEKQKIKLSKLGANKKCFFLTEDEKIENLKAFLEIHDFNLDETEIISYYGVSNLNSASKVLGEHLRSKFPNSKIILHRDRDYLSDNEIAQERVNIENKNITYFVTTGTDIESHFINIDYLDDVFSKKYDDDIEIKKDDIAKYIDEATNECKDDSLSKFFNEYFKKPKKNTYKENQELLKKYENNTERYRYGKGVLKRIKSKIQKHLKRTPNMIQKSQYIINQELYDFGKSCNFT